MNSNTVVLSGREAEAVAAMLAAVKAEADTRDNVAQELMKAMESAWGRCRDLTLSVLLAKPKAARKGEDKPATPDVLAGLVLDALRDACKEAAKTQESMKRGVQYASDLRRAVKAMQKGKTLPAELHTASRSAWNESEFWKEAGILAASGRRAGQQQQTQQGGKEGEGEQQEALPVDAELSELMRLVAVLRGPFRAEFIKEATELARRCAAKQHTATGGAYEDAPGQKQADAA